MFLVSKFQRTQIKNQGFSLVEMSIVLIVIGLIMGAIIKGGAIVRATKIKATISEMNSVKRSALIFRNKYGTYPGDFGRATLEVLNCIGTSGCEDGNNDGKVVSLGGGGDPDEEAQFWKHLFLTNLRKNEIFDSPLNSGALRIYYDAYSIGGSPAGYMGGTGKHWMILESSVGARCCFSSKEQHLLDIKLDDGDVVGAVFSGGTTGNIRFFIPPFPDPEAPKIASGPDIRDGGIAIALD